MTLMLLTLWLLLGGTAAQAFAQPLAGDSLTVSAALSEAFLNGPTARRLTARRELAAATRTVEGRLLLSPPTVGVSTTLGTDLRRDPDDQVTEWTLELPLEVPTVTLARRRAALGRYQSALAATRADRIELIAEVRSAAATLAVRTAEAALMTRLAVSAETLLVATERRYAAGDVSELSRNLVAIDVATAAAEAAAAAREMAEARARLNLLLGRDGREPTTITWTSALRSPDTTTASAGQVTVQAAETALQAARDELRYRRQARWLPAFDLALGYGRSTLFYGPGDLQTRSGRPLDLDRLGRSGQDLRLGLSLPLPFGAETRGEAQRAGAELRLAATELAATETQVAVEIATARRRVALATVALVRFEQVAPLLADNLDLIGQAFSGGQIDLPTLLTERDRLIRAQLGLLRAQLEAVLARIELAWALGTDGMIDGETGP